MQARMQTFEKGGCEFKGFNNRVMNLKKIPTLRPKFTQFLVKTA